MSSRSIVIRVALLSSTLLLTACGGESTDNQAMEPAMSTLNGTVTYRERMPLRLDSVITVRLQDVSLQDAPAMLLAEQTIEGKGKSVPIPYQLEYDPQRIQERNSYSVRAEIRDAAGKLLWTTDTVHPVLTRGAPENDVEIQLVLVAN